MTFTIKKMISQLDNDYFNRYIKHYDNSYRVIKDKIPYGSFKDEQVACEFLEYCLSVNWNKKLCKKERVKLWIKYYKPRMYITCSGGKFNVVKNNVDGRCLSFGRFANLDEAMAHRDYCVEMNWNIQCRNVSRSRGCTKVGERYISVSGSKFVVSKNISGVLERFDVCSTLEEAVACRDFWVSVGWDWDCVDLS